VRKIVNFLLVIAVLLCFSTSVCAQGNVSDIINGKQEYLLLATVMDVNNSSVVVAPYYNIYNGDGTKEISLSESIEISKFRYSYCSDHVDISATPRVGDNIFVSLNKSGGGYTVANGAYKTSSVDYKLLTFYASESMKDKDCLAEIVALAYFVRTDGSMRDFRLEDGTLTVENDGKVLTLYPNARINEVITFVNINGQAVDNIKTRDVITDGEPSVDIPDDGRWIVAIAFVVISMLIGAVVVYNINTKDIRFRKQKRE